MIATSSLKIFVNSGTVCRISHLSNPLITTNQLAKSFSHVLEGIPRLRWHCVVALVDWLTSSHVIDQSEETKRAVVANMRFPALSHWLYAYAFPI